MMIKFLYLNQFFLIKIAKQMIVKEQNKVQNLCTFHWLKSEIITNKNIIDLFIKETLSK